MVDPRVMHMHFMLTRWRWLGSACGALTTTACHRCLSRALSQIRPHVGHHVWTDRGLSDVATFEALAAKGFKCTGLMAKGRVGLPRRWLAQAAAKLKCPRACKHDRGAESYALHVGRDAQR